MPDLCVNWPCVCPTMCERLAITLACLSGFFYGFLCLSSLPLLSPSLFQRPQFEHALNVNNYLPQKYHISPFPLFTGFH